MDTAVRLLIAGGAPLLQLGLISGLQHEARLHVTGQAADMPEALARLRQEPYEVLLLHSEAPRVDAAAAMALLGAADAPRLLLLTYSDSREELLGALRSSVPGYGILRGLDAEDLCAGVLALARHGSWLCPKALDYLRTAVFEQPVSAPLSGPVLLSRAPDLSHQEKRVLELFAAGLGELAIARRLSLSQNTVKTYLSRIREKFAVRTRAEAVSKAFAFGLIPDRRAGAAPAAPWPRRGGAGDGPALPGGILEDRRAPR